MAIEIERKFLVVGEAWRDEAQAAPKRYRQAYLAFSEHAVVRVRLSDADQAAWLCLKERKVGASRAEFEYAVPMGDAQDLLRLATGEIIEKYRYLVRNGEHVWEVDEFLGANAGLIVAEIELSAETEAFTHPAWLDVEVSDDERYYNASLAINPYRNWKVNTP